MSSWLPLFSRQIILFKLMLHGMIVNSTLSITAYVCTESSKCAKDRVRYISSSKSMISYFIQIAIVISIKMSTSSTRKRIFSTKSKTYFQLINWHLPPHLKLIGPSSYAQINDEMKE